MNDTVDVAAIFDEEERKRQERSYAKESDLKVAATGDMGADKGAIQREIAATTDSLKQVKIGTTDHDNLVERLADLHRWARQADEGPSTTTSQPAPNKPAAPAQATTRTTRGTPEQQVALSGQFTQYLTSQQALQKQLQQALMGSATQRTAEGNANLEYGKAAADAADSKGIIDVAKLVKTEYINKLIGANSEDPNSALVRAHKSREEARIKMDALRPVIDAEEAVQPWDDPLRWIANQFTQPALKAEYNAAWRTDKQLSERVTRIQQDAKEQQQIDPAIVVEQTQRNAAAHATAARMEAIVKASGAFARSNEVLAQAVQSEIMIGEHGMEKFMQMARLQQDTLQLRERKEVQDKLNKKEQWMQGVVDTISTKRNAIGMPSTTVQELEMMGKERAGAMIEWAQYPELGRGPGDSMKNVREFGTPSKMAETMPAVTSFINRMRTSDEFRQLKEAYIKADDKQFAKLPNDIQQEVVMQRLYDEQNKELANFEDPKNPARGSDNSKLATNNPYRFKHQQTTQYIEMRDQPWVKTMANTALLSPTRSDVSDKDIMLTFLGKVEADPAKVAEMSKQLADYYSRGTTLQWQMSGAALLGYAKPRSYGVTDPMGDGKDFVNMYSPQEIEHWAIRKLARKAVPPAPFGGSAGPAWGVPAFGDNKVLGVDFQ